MSENTPQRPEGMDNTGATPRVEVEPTPTNTQDAAGEFDTKPMPQAEAAANETTTRTVVKVKTKKLPVFVASLGGLVIGAVLVIALVMAGAFRITDSNIEAASQTSATQEIKIDPEDTTLAETVAAKALPSVVSISTSTSEGGSIGSGVILDTDGNIITNNHVIEGAETIQVNVDGGTSYEAELVGADPSSDLAVIHITNLGDAKLTPVELGDSDDLTVGEWVMAIGSPFGNEQSVSTGIVSALYRSTALPSTSGSSIYANMIQTDAAINPGNSGGALVNDQGQLIGINSIIESYSGSSSGVGFAIPINYAKNIADQILAGETPAHPYLGVNVSSVTPQIAARNNLSVDNGALIASVIAGTPAEEAGLQVNDVVTKIDDDEVTSADSLIILLRERNVGDKVTLTINRDGKDQKIDVTLGSDADLQAEQQDSSEGNGSGNSMTEEEFLQYLQELLGSGYGWGQSQQSSL